MPRRDRQMQQRRRENHDGGVEIRRESVHGMHFENLAADRADDLPAADARAKCHGGRAEELHDIRHLERLDEAARDERERDDAHRLLRIVRAVGECHERRRYDLQAVGREIDRRRLVRMAESEDELHHEEADQHRRDRRQHERQHDLHDAPAVERRRARRDEHGADDATNQRVRRARRHAEPPRQEVPDDRADKAGDDDHLIHEIGAHDDIAANRLRHARRNHRADEIEHCRADDGDARSDRARRDTRRDGVRRIVETIDEIKGECEQHDHDEE